MANLTEERLRETICHFLSYHKEKDTPFFKFILSATDSEIVGSRLVWNLSEKYYLYISIDFATRDIRVLGSASDNHRTAAKANQITLELFVSEIKSWISIYDQRYKDQIVYSPLYQYVTSVLSIAIQSILFLPHFSKYLEEINKGAVSGDLLFFWSDSVFVWFCFDPKNESIAVTTDLYVIPPSQQPELEIEVVQKLFKEIIYFLTEYQHEYQLYVTAQEIITNPISQEILAKDCFVDNNILYWRVQNREIFRIDTRSCTTHLVESPTDIVTYSPQLSKQDEKNLAEHIDRTLKSRGAERKAAKPSQKISDLFIGPFSCN